MTARVSGNVGIRMTVVFAASLALAVAAGAETEITGRITNRSFEDWDTGFIGWDAYSSGYNYPSAGRVSGGLGVIDGDYAAVVGHRFNSYTKYANSSTWFQQTVDLTDVDTLTFYCRLTNIDDYNGHRLERILKIDGVIVWQSSATNTAWQRKSYDVSSLTGDHTIGIGAYVNAGISKYAWDLEYYFDLVQLWSGLPDNLPPTAPTNCSIAPPDPLTDDDLTASASGSADGDLGDTISYEYQWCKSTDDGVTWSAWGNDGTALLSAVTTKDDQWKARARATDGTDVSGWTESDPVTIGKLVITYLKVFDVTRTSAVVNWTTNLPASSEVGFDTSSQGSYDDYPSTSTGPGETLYHAVLLAGLTNDETYYLRARSVAGGSTAVSDEIIFTTSDIQQPTLVYSGDTSGTCGAEETVTLAGTLTYGDPPLALETKTLSFVCNGWTGTGVTDENGKAEVTVEAARLGVGTHKVFVRFAGELNVYLPASAQGQIVITRNLTHTIVRGKGTFLRDGERGHRCIVEFRFNAGITAGWLKFFEPREQKRISVEIVQSITFSPDPSSGPQAIIVCGPDYEYTVTVNADTDAFSIVDDSVEPPYEASTPALRGDVVIEEGQLE